MGGVAGGLALSKHDSLVDSAACDPDECLPSARSDVSGLDTLRTVSTTGFIVGGVLTATGVALLLTSKSSTEVGQHGRPVAIRLSPSGIAASGVF